VLLLTQHIYQARRGRAAGRRDAGPGDDRPLRSVGQRTTGWKGGVRTRRNLAVFAQTRRGPAGPTPDRCSPDFDFWSRLSRPPPQERLHVGRSVTGGPPRATSPITSCSTTAEGTYREEAPIRDRREHNARAWKAARRAAGESGCRPTGRHPRQSDYEGTLHHQLPGDVGRVKDSCATRYATGWPGESAAGMPSRARLAGPCCSIRRRPVGPWGDVRP